jgi:toxin ParE1/3/4
MDRTALGHLDAIHEYISRDSSTHARLVVDRLTARSRQIAEFPYSGRAVPEQEEDRLREVLEGSYRLIYEIHTARIVVLAVIHGARELPPLK